MDFPDQLAALATRAAKQKDLIKTEEATKNALVMPFIQALGYDIFEPSEVVPEFTADVGSKKGEKVDYAIAAGGKITMLFECKSCGFNLNDCHASQLRRYFHVTTARISVLTNGIVYRFYSDLDEKNKMDEKPFMEVNLLSLDEHIVPELKKLTKNTFEIDQMLSTANDLKYIREIKNLLETEFDRPSPDFVRFVLSGVYSGLKTQQVIDQFTPITKQAIQLLINGKINDRLKSALKQEEPEEPITLDASEVPEIITTQDEIDGFYIIRAILHQMIDVSRIFMRDTKSYFAILLDDSNRKTICRLHFNTAQKYLGIINPDKSETKHPIQSLADIYKFSEQLRASLNNQLMQADKSKHNTIETQMN